MTRATASALHVESLRRALADFDPARREAERWGDMLAAAFADRKRLLAAGNGGSAAQVQHFIAELVGQFRATRRPFPAVCLSAETATLTAIANDFPPEELFARQVEAHGDAGDVLVLLSTSGRSRNILGAARRGRALGLTVCALTGPTPNPLAEYADRVIAVDAERTATIQELHLLALHLVCLALDEWSEPAVPAVVDAEPGR